MNYTEPNAYLFDIGNVILGFDFSIAVERLRAFGTLVDDPLAHITETKNRYESGQIDDAQFVDSAIAELDFGGSGADFIPIWQEIFHENAPMVEAIRHLSGQGHPLYLLSNTNSLHLQHILRDYPIFAKFTGGIYSHEAGSMKPDQPIYRQAIETFNLTPGQTLYIDDLAANIETGRSLGFQTHLYDLDNHAAFLEVIGHPPGQI